MQKWCLFCQTTFYRSYPYKTFNKHILIIITSSPLLYNIPCPYTGWPRSYRKYILQITPPSQYGYATLQYRFAVTSGSPSNMHFWVRRIHILSRYRHNCVSKKSCPFLYCDFTMKIWHNFLQTDSSYTHDHCVMYMVLGDPEVTANLYCNFAYLYWEGCVICSIYLR